jgi:mono/diheme cytochrome c family protein
MFVGAVELAGQTAGKTVWDGVYTEAQAQRGSAVYTKECSSCHGDDLAGQGSRLMGDRFMRDWREDSVMSLFQRTKSVMPRRTPGSLTDAQYLDVIAYVLQENEFPAGTNELTTDLAATVAIVGKDGPQPVPEFALIQTAGCLTQSGSNWVLQNAGEPVRTRVPELSPSELQGSRGTALGTGSFRLLDPGPYKPELHKDHKVAVKGLLIRRPDNRINVTAIDTIAETCAP